MNKNKNIEAYILCGGVSSRFGSDKALAQLDGRPVIEIVASELKKVFEKVILVTASPEKYKFLGLECIIDIYPGCGPLAGIHAALKNCKTEKAFIISCDMPLINEEIINYIVSYKTAFEILMPIALGRKHYLCAVYNKSVFSIAEELLEDTKDQPKCASPFDLISISGYDTINFDNLLQFNIESFFNLNSKEDLGKLEKN